MLSANIALGEKGGITQNTEKSNNSKCHGNELYFYQQVMSTIVGTSRPVIKIFLSS